MRRNLLSVPCDWLYSSYTWWCCLSTEQQQIFPKQVPVLGHCRSLDFILST